MQAVDRKGAALKVMILEGLELKVSGLLQGCEAHDVRGSCTAIKAMNLQGSGFSGDGRYNHGLRTFQTSETTVSFTL